MDLTSKRVIKNLLKKHKIRPSKWLGQNFLIDKSVIKKVIKAAELCPEDIILEIGPGIGAITQELAKRAKKIIAVEKDPKMCKILEETLKDFKNVKIINKDILKYQIAKRSLGLVYDSKNQKYKVVANLPFYITAPVIRKFLESNNPPQEMILIVQKEVAQRICSKPPKMNLLAVSVQFYSKAKIISYISKKSFWPQPKVDSAILKISAFNRPRKSVFNQRFFRIVKDGFSQPRKQLANNLSNSLKLNKEQIKLWLFKNNIQPSQRAETLTIKDWFKLTKM